MTTFDTHSTLAYSNVVSVVSQDDDTTTLILNVVPDDGALFAVDQQLVIFPAGVQPIIGNAMICRLTDITGDQLTIDYSSGSREGTSIRGVEPGDQIANPVTPKIFLDIEN